MKFLAFGEMLWDIFGDTRTLGGAPLNIAGHMARLGATSSIVSYIGCDELGRQALKTLGAIGVCDTYIGRNCNLDTGIANIQLEKGIPRYEFNDPCAWDAITLDDELKARLKEDQPDVFYFGTLAQRSTTSHDTLSWLLRNLNCRIVFFDVNLRKQFYGKDCIIAGLHACSILKMNDEELPIIVALAGINPMLDEHQAVKMLCDTYTIKTVLVTKGKQGTLCYHEGLLFSRKPQDVKVIDTVGAGDSFSAGFLRAYFETEDIKLTLRLGSGLADYVVSRAGAIPEYDESLRKNWAKIL